MVVLSVTGSPVNVLEAIGIVGIGVASVLFVVLGNPSAGGAYQLPLLPGFWRTIGDTLPNGAGVDALRSIVHFDGHGTTAHLVTIAAYGLGESIAALAATTYLIPQRRQKKTSSSARAADRHGGSMMQATNSSKSATPRASAFPPSRRTQNRHFEGVVGRRAQTHSAPSCHQT